MVETKGTGRATAPDAHKPISCRPVNRQTTGQRSDEALQQLPPNRADRLSQVSYPLTIPSHSGLLTL